MNFWWVNHKQTAKKELGGGYIWAPKINKDNSYNQTYENLKYAAAGDIIFSYANVQIKAIGVIETAYIESDVPDEFGQTGNRWNKDGYLVKVFWIPLIRPLSPKSVIGEIQNLLPIKYSPLQQNGNGNQKCYLAGISDELGGVLLGMLSRMNEQAVDSLYDIQASLINEAEQQQIAAAPILQTEKTQLIKARIGQGLYRERLLKIEDKCRITGATDTKFLIASHIKPWRMSDNQEKLDGNNGLLLSPHVDALFDKGWMSFKNNGEVIWAASKITDSTVAYWRLTQRLAGNFNSNQKQYLDFHRDVIFNARASQHL